MNFDLKFGRGEGGEEWGGGLLWSPASCFLCSPVGERDHTSTIGRPQGSPPRPTPPPPLLSLRKNICGHQTSSAQWNDLPGNHATMLAVEKARQREDASETQQRRLCRRHRP